MGINVSRTTIVRAVAGVFMLVGVLGFAPSAQAQEQGYGLEPTVDAVGCTTWGLSTGDHTCPLTRIPSADPTDTDLLLYEYLALFDAADAIHSIPYWADFEIEGYIGSSQSGIDYTTGVATAFVYVYNSEWTVYHVVRHKRFYPELCGYCAAPEGFEDSVTYLGLGIYNL